MKNYGIRLICHNIPNVIHRHFNGVFGFRVQNLSENTLHFHSHYSFYGNKTHSKKLQLKVFLNNKFLVDALLFDDMIKSKQKDTIFFPFQSKEAGKCNLKIMISRYGSILPDDSICILRVNIDVKANVSKFYYYNDIRIILFHICFLYIPINIKYVKLYFYKSIRFSNFFRKYFKSFDIISLKYLNRELAFLEKQSRRLRVRSFPCYLGIDTTSKCNLECKSCFRRYCGDDFKNKKEMESVEMDSIINTLFPTAYTLNISTVGEPLLSDHMERILEACTEYRVSLSFTTNGTLLRGERFLEKLASVLSHIEISIDSASPALFEELRTGASYNQVIGNARNLGKIRRNRPDPKFNFGFSMTLFRENLEEIPEVLHLVSEIGGNFLKTDIGVIFEKKDFHRSVLCVPELYNKAYENAHRTAEQIGIRLLMRSPFSTDCELESGKYGICDYLYLSACVNSEGKLNPCYFQVIPSLKIGNGFANAWNSKILQRLRLEHDTNKGHPLCRDCYLILEGSDSVENRRKQFLKGDALKWGTVINFAEGGNADYYKVTGWGKAEGLFTWTEGGSASLNIPISATKAPFVTLKAGLSAFLSPGKVDKQTVSILINNKAVGIWVFVKPGLQEKMVFIPRESFVKSSNMEIIFHTPDAVSPAQAGLNNDERVLGLAVHTIELTE